MRPGGARRCTGPVAARDYTEWALHTADPLAHVTILIEALIGSLDAAAMRPAADSADRQIWDLAETELRLFLDQVRLRLSALLTLAPAPSGEG